MKRTDDKKSEDGEGTQMDLKGRSFLKLLDYTPEEILYLVDLAAELKDKKKKRILTKEMHQGKNIVLIFEKTSTRRVSWLRADDR